MMLKWLFLVILVWYAFRSAGNLIRELAGGQSRESVPPPPRNKVHVPRPKAADKSAVESSSLDVEDARFEDL
ncbi:MAG: hypothetical protein HOE73_03605 [Bacteroidetes Order II. Incertae sedis bacterium]|jgi:hypothetical protein|nr:hypothetical protein [Bacteroidetes Order II. bacterium]MBT4052157.1 hypothetical protein [Bacteroidetes Order II. bacterium]MBT5248886.1 hypothetical protein [Bacteroidetes Order II. bacterium]MBT6199347.1 hypothetical protein [Bacteroidetes Order II. bacterium]MBT6424342.1 hypothetical protein [Bacteroidetes Order II. bacterium]